MLQSFDAYRDKKQKIVNFVLGNLEKNDILCFREEFKETGKSVFEIAEQFLILPILSWCSLTPLDDDIPLKTDIIETCLKKYSGVCKAASRIEFKTVFADELKADKYEWYAKRYYANGVIHDSQLPPSNRLDKFTNRLKDSTPQQKPQRCPVCGQT